jgi:hypothetical protein
MRVVRFGGGDKGADVADVSRDDDVDGGSHGM